ncbi:hypothetical protein ACFSHT_17615 [Paraburkholderia silviterrae]|uniref:Uncharacterized protein n=1 Tax=Paraburkholderia silviterrae TaxID=2528715 RepID=A0A4R5M4N9_9BURK|nr:hypothetical protein [Paraburkholderia silviterrae]TDG20352.1 hypothetical protein EYW47_26240 [Paraburkholderia silviterrae]
MGKRHHGKMTAKENSKGVEVIICDVTWFDATTTYSVANSPERTAELTFTADDLNYFARVLFAEASGASMLPDLETRKAEKEAIINTTFFRINRKGYPNNKYIATTFAGVCNAEGQFQTVTPKLTQKMQSVMGSQYKNLGVGDCSDLQEAIDAIKLFMESGPNSKYTYDNFRGGDKGQGKNIGHSRFWLSPVGAGMAAKIP